MQLYSTNNKNNIVDLKEATLHSLPRDKGLYLPTEIPKISPDFLKNLHHHSFQEISYRVAHLLIGQEIPEKEIESMIHAAINFDAPVIHLGDNIYTQELYHGPSLAFKDFGARFMAQLMSYFMRNENKTLTILVATSGDTGGAVAAGFHQVENIEVIILYPKGQVSSLQEKQLTTWGDNITAVEWDGSFDDCQAVVKRAFHDDNLLNSYNLSSANSINIARLIPQSFYYFEAVKQLDHSKEIIISVPSGNIGNISAGSIARNMGLKIKQLIAAHNSNASVPDFYRSGIFSAKKSRSTISNAMDVGNPSNFPRFLNLNGSTWNNLKNNTASISISEEETITSLQEIYSKYNYVSEPHAAVAYHALPKKNTQDQLLFLGTAHPAKFKDTVDHVLNTNIDLPTALSEIKNLKGLKTELSTYDEFVRFMKSRT